MAAEQADQQAQALDLFAEELRLAQDHLNSITGEFTSDDLLGTILRGSALVVRGGGPGVRPAHHRHGSGASHLTMHRTIALER